jgi:hypothetical protein
MQSKPVPETDQGRHAKIIAGPHEHLNNVGRKLRAGSRLGGDATQGLYGTPLPEVYGLPEIREKNPSTPSNAKI